MSAGELQTGLNVARLEDRGDAAVLQRASAPLQDDWMIIDDQNRGHAERPMSGGRAERRFSIEMTT